MRAFATTVLVALAPVLAAHEASYLMRGGAAPVNVDRDGHVQTVTPVGDGWLRVRVSTPLAPVGSRGTWQALRAAGPVQLAPAGFELPRELAGRLRPEAEAWEVASEILAWVTRSVVLDSEELASQDATSVLARRKGRCSGLANAAAALLIAAGFEARTVSGLLIEGDGATPHRWLEVRLPGVGWVASDPTLGLWLLTPRHVEFSAPVEALPELRVERVESLELAFLPRRSGLPMRPNAGAELVCRLTDGRGPALAVLSGPAGETRRVLAAPEARFERLFPGRWRLEVSRDNVVLEQLLLELRAGEVHSCLIAEGPTAPPEVES